MKPQPKIALQLYSIHKYTDSVGLARTLADAARPRRKRRPRHRKRGHPENIVVGNACDVAEDGSEVVVDHAFDIEILGKREGE